MSEISEDKLTEWLHRFYHSWALTDDILGEEGDRAYQQIKKLIEQMTKDDRIYPNRDDRNWLCECGKRPFDDDVDKWRWDGRNWQHYHGYPIGHEIARYNPVKKEEQPKQSKVDELTDKISKHMWELIQEIGINGLQIMHRDKFISEASNSIRFLVKQLLQSKQQKVMVSKELAEECWQEILEHYVDNGFRGSNIFIQRLKEFGVEVGE